MIENDKLIREIPVYKIPGYGQQDCIGIRKDCIITKEEFLECYNEWVVKPTRENHISIQTKFYIPADNGGVTPV